MVLCIHYLFLVPKYCHHSKDPLPIKGYFSVWPSLLSIIVSSLLKIKLSGLIRAQTSLVNSCPITFVNCIHFSASLPPFFFKPKSIAISLVKNSDRLSLNHLSVMKTLSTHICTVHLAHFSSYASSVACVTHKLYCKQFLFC